MMSIHLGNIAILNIQVSDYCCITSLITLISLITSKNEAINLMENTNLTKKCGTL